MLKAGFISYILLIGFQSFSQLYLPTTNYYQTEAERFLLSDSLQQPAFNQHVSIRPLLDKRTQIDKLYKSEGKYYYWITQKLFKENFIIFKGDDFWCSIDPILDVEMGTDFSADSIDLLYWNTRGIRVQGKFFDKVGFTTQFYENQAILPNYQQDYAKAHGEFFPNGPNTAYTQQNAVIPGYARTKPFKTNGYDFAFATGNVSYVPNEHLNFQIGNGNQFIGNGYRSLLLSDYAVNYPFAKIETNFWDGRIQYNAIYAIHQNLYRLHEYTTPEATFEKKIGTYHYLDIAVTENIEIGFFEGNLWRRVDSLGSHQPDYLFLNPTPFVNTIIKGTDNSGFNAILGVNASFSFKTNRLYAQAVLDNGKLGSYQIGIKALNLLIEKFDLGLEFNHAELNTYLTRQKRYNYSHYNLPLAHPYVNGFNELIVTLNYQYNRLFFQNRFNYSQRTLNDNALIGNDILAPSSIITAKENRMTSVVYNQLEIGYRFNNAYNLQFFIGHLYRNETSPSNNPLTNYAYIGIRTKLNNKYYDY